MGGSCGCCSCGCCTREEKHKYYVRTILSADETIKHWEAAVEAGESILWASLSETMEKTASDVIDEFAEAMVKMEQITFTSLEKQFDIIKGDKEAVLEKARETHGAILEEASVLSSAQREILHESAG